jgi:phosphoglycerate kinase
VFEALLEKVATLIVGGGIANTLLAAVGVQVGKSLCEKDMLDMARKLLDPARARRAQIVLPVDVVVAHERLAAANAEARPVAQVAAVAVLSDPDGRIRGDATPDSVALDRTPASIYAASIRD